MNKTIRIGIFTTIGLAIIVGFSFYVNDHPYWYRTCNQVGIHVDDATGLRMKSPVKTLGLEIGYIQSVTLDGDRVLIHVCVTAPVKLNSETKAYIKSLGFLGDKFLELKPVDSVKERSFLNRTNSKKENDSSSLQPNQDSINEKAAGTEKEEAYPVILPKEEKPLSFIDWIIPSANAEERVPQQSAETGGTLTASREGEIADTVKKVGKLVDQLTLMVGDVRELTQQKEFKETVINLNKSMKNLEMLLRPEGKTVANLNASLESLRNAMAQADDVMKKVNRGEGTIGKFVNDPSIFDELKAAINSVNLLLGKAGALKTFIDISAWQIPAYDGAKGRFSLKIQPNPGRYYLVGVSNDPRGKETRTTTTTIMNNGTPSVEQKTVNQDSGIKITAMLGKYFGPLDLSVGFLEDVGALRMGYWLDPDRRYGMYSEIYKPSKQEAITTRLYGRAQIWSGLYVAAGVDSIHVWNRHVPYFMGLGLFFDDDDFKYLLAFK